MSDRSALVAEIANELATWPGVAIERLSRSTAVVRYEHHELGVLDEERGLVELPFGGDERDRLVEEGDAEPAEDGVSHELLGPSDVTAVLELFDRRYRDLRGEDDPYSSSDSS
jgi:hypothetical protein